MTTTLVWMSFYFHHYKKNFKETKLYSFETIRKKDVGLECAEIFTAKSMQRNLS
jgi:hypothetical protein